MIVDLNHTGLVVKNLDEAVSFYRDAIGLSLASAIDIDNIKSDVRRSQNSSLVGGSGIWPWR